MRIFPQALSPLLVSCYGMPHEALSSLLSPLSSLCLITQAGCSADVSGSDRLVYRTRVSPLTTEDGADALLVTPSIVATNAVLVYSEPSHTLQAAIMDTSFSSTVEGRALLTAVELENPAVNVVTEIASSKDIGGTILLSEGDFDFSVRLYGQDANGSAIRGASFEDEQRILEGFSLAELEAYEASRDADQEPTFRRHRTCCCRCNGQSCGCVDCQTTTCFCDCVHCSASCSVVISG